MQRKTTSTFVSLSKVLIASAILAVSITAARSQVGNVLWEDNFNSLNTDVWVPDVGDGCPDLCGWGNGELQSYETSNVYISDVPGESGNKALVLEARNQTSGSRVFTSGKVTTKSLLSIQYGLIEVRLRVPNLETGLWPAVWLLGTSNVAWPAKGEIDMMEMGHSLAARTDQGYPASTVNNYLGANAIFANTDGSAGSIAYDANYNQPYVSGTPMNDRFIVCRLYWEPTQLRYTVVDNGTEYDLYTGPLPLDPDGVTAPFTKPFYLLLNLAVGGNFTDATSNGQVTAPLPGKMYIDYVRVSQWNGYGEVKLNYGELQPEAGVFGVYTDNTATSNRLTLGTDAEIYGWGGTVQQGTTVPYEGSNVIAWETTAANSWFGGGIVATQGKNMSGYAQNGSLKFKIKIPANVSFRIGITDNYTNETYINFPANQDRYGLVRNGEWGQVEIPLADYAGLLAFQNISYMFAITSVDGALPTSTFQFAIDDIVWDDGNGATVAVTGVSVSPTTVTLASGEQQQLTGTVSPADATNKNVTWSSSNSSVATVNSGGLVTAVGGGTATITVTTADGGFTAHASVTVTAGVPSPWETGDIGAVAAAGSASFSNGTFSIEGSGADIWGTTDEFRYVYQQISGDVTITAKVNSVTNTNNWAKAGVMIRESLSGSSKHAMLIITPRGVSAFQRRTATGGASTHTAGPTANAPYWVRLQRTGDSFTSAVSANGTDWTTVGTTTISMSTSVYVGLAVTSHSDGAICTGTFSNVDVSAGSTTSPTGCSQSGPNGDYTAEISQDPANPAITFVPGATGIGSSLVILYYSTDPNSTFPGYTVSPNAPYQITALSGQTVYFYYTYSVPEGGERNSSATPHSFVVGDCSGSSSRLAGSEMRSGELDEQVSGFELFPNPSADRITLRAPKEEGKMSLTILDVSGRSCNLVPVSGEAGYVFDISGLSPGIYFLRIDNQRQQPEILRFIKR